MSVMSSQRRKIAKLHKDRVAIVRAAFKPEEYDKHRAHKKMIERFLNEERAQEEYESLSLQSVSA